MKEQPQEKKTDFSGTPCVQQESDPKEEKELTKKRFSPFLIYFLCILGLMMILFLVLLITGDYIASIFGLDRLVAPGDRLMGTPAPRKEMYEFESHIGKHHDSAHGGSIGEKVNGE